MATLYAQGFELEFSYYNLNSCENIEYSFEIRLKEKPLFHSDILSKKEWLVKDGKFIVDRGAYGGKYPGEKIDDWIYIFFSEILKTKKGSTTGTSMITPIEWIFKAVTWEDQKLEKEKSWAGKTCAVGQDDGSIVHEPYAETMKMFIPLWENNIEFSIEFPYEAFEFEEYTNFKLSLTTTFAELGDFIEELEEEMKEFYKFFGDRITYLDDGTYTRRDDFDDLLLWDDKYVEKKCAEWNDKKNEFAAKIAITNILNFMKDDSTIVTLATELLNTTISIDVAKKMFFITESILKVEKEKEMIEIFAIIKKIIAIVFPNALTVSQRNDAFMDLKKEDIPEKIYEKNKEFYHK
jgi:hypothetical protein